MGIKKYILASIILIIAIAGYVFSIESGDYRLQIVDQTFIFPVVVWILAPTIVLFIATLIHMFYYGLKGFLSTRSIQKDNENLISLIKQRLLGKESSLTFKSAELKEVGEVLGQLDIKLSDPNFSSSNKKISEVAEHILNINAGKYVSSRDLKLSNENPLMEQNLKNRIDIDDNFALEVVKQPKTYTDEVVKYAFIKAVETKSMTTIKKIIEELTLDLDMLYALVKKDSQEKSEFSLDNSTLLKLIKAVEVTNKDLINIACEYKKTTSPEQLMKLFEDLMSFNEQFTESYIYVLSEYEMIDNIREILANSQKDEFAIYKAYLDLRDAGKHYSLDTFI